MVDSHAIIYYTLSCLACFIILIYDNKRADRYCHIQFDRSLSSTFKIKENSMHSQQKSYRNPYLSGSPYPLQKRYDVLSGYFAFNSITAL